MSGGASMTSRNTFSWGWGMTALPDLYSMGSRVMGTLSYPVIGGSPPLALYQSTKQSFTLMGQVIIFWKFTRWKWTGWVSGVRLTISKSQTLPSQQVALVQFWPTCIDAPPMNMPATCMSGPSTQFSTSNTLQPWSNAGYEMASFNLMEVRLSTLGYPWARTFRKPDFTMLLSMAGWLVVIFMMVPVNLSTRFMGSPLGWGAGAVFFSSTSPNTLLRSMTISRRAEGESKYSVAMTVMGKKSPSSLMSWKGSFWPRYRKKMLRYLAWHAFRKIIRYTFLSSLTLGHTLPLTVMVLPQNQGTQVVNEEDGEASGQNSDPLVWKDLSAIEKQSLVRFQPNCWWIAFSGPLTNDYSTIQQKPARPAYTLSLVIPQVWSWYQNSPGSCSLGYLQTASFLLQGSSVWYVLDLPPEKVQQCRGSPSETAVVTSPCTCGTTGTSLRNSGSSMKGCEQSTGSMCRPVMLFTHTILTGIFFLAMMAGPGYSPTFPELVMAEQTYRVVLGQLPGSIFWLAFSMDMVYFSSPTFPSACTMVDVGMATFGMPVISSVNINDWIRVGSRSYEEI